MDRDLPYARTGGAGQVSSKVNAKFVLPAMQRPQVKGSPIMGVNGQRDSIYGTNDSRRHLNQSQDFTKSHSSKRLMTRDARLSVDHIPSNSKMYDSRTEKKSIKYQSQNSSPLSRSGHNPVINPVPVNNQNPYFNKGP